MKIFILLTLLQATTQDVVRESFNLSQIAPSAFYKKSETYNSHFLIDFKHTPDHSLAEYNDIQFRIVNYPVNNSKIITPGDEDSSILLKVDSNELKQIIETYDCKTKGIILSSKVQYNKQKEVLYDNYKSIVFTYLGPYGISLALETLYYSSKLADINSIYEYGNFCLVKTESDHQDTLNGKKIIYSDLYSYVEVQNSKLENLIDFAKANERSQIDQFKPVMTNYYANKFFLGINGMAASFLNPYIYIDTLNFKIYPLLLDVQNIFENIRHNDKFLAMYGFPYVSYLQYELENGITVSETAKVVSTFHILFIYSYYSDIKHEKTNINKAMTSDPLWNKYVETWHTHIIMHHETNNKESCLSMLAENLVEFIPKVSKYFTEIFKDGHTSILSNPALLMPRFSRVNLNDNSLVHSLIRDKINGAIGESWQKTDEPSLKDESLILSYINYPDNVDYYKMLKNCWILSVVGLFVIGLAF